MVTASTWCVSGSTIKMESRWTSEHVDRALHHRNVEHGDGGSLPRLRDPRGGRGEECDRRIEVPFEDGVPRRGVGGFRDTESGHRQDRR